MADLMKDPRVEMLKVGMTQHGRGMPIQVFRGTSRYQYGGGVGEASVRSGDSCIRLLCAAPPASSNMAGKHSHSMAALKKH